MNTNELLSFDSISVTEGLKKHNGSLADCYEFSYTFMVPATSYLSIYVCMRTSFRKWPRVVIHRMVSILLN